MTAEAAGRHLENANEKLRETVEQLLEMRDGMEQRYPALGSAAESVRIAHEGFPPSAGPELQVLVHDIRVRAARAQLLLESAASFYCGWLCARPPHWADYTANGEMQRAESAGGLRVEA